MQFESNTPRELFTLWINAKFVEKMCFMCAIDAKPKWWHPLKWENEDNIYKYYHMNYDTCGTNTRCVRYAHIQYLTQNTNQRSSQPVIEFMAFVVQCSRNVICRVTFPTNTMNHGYLWNYFASHHSGKLLYVHCSMNSVHITIQTILMIRFK